MYQPLTINGLEEDFKQNLYCFLLKLIDMEVYKLEFKFTRAEVNFYTTYNIDTILKEAIELCSKDILYYKKQIKKAKVKIDQ